MSLKFLATAIAAVEGKKVQVNIAQISEILGIVADSCWETPGFVWLLAEAGRRRAHARAKSKKQRKKAKRK